MQLHRFMDERRDEILELTKRRILGATAKGTDEELMESIPELYDDIVAHLRGQAGLVRKTEATRPEKSAAVHGTQRLRLGFTITQLVHDYGAVCQAITETAENEGGITPKEYQVLNEVLDAAIAEAVSAYSDEREAEHDRRADERATVRLGFVAHELRNTIAAAMLSFDAVRRGQVGVRGRTSNVLERSLLRLRTLIDRSLTEVRLESGLTLSRESTNFRQVLEDVEASVIFEAEAKQSEILIQAAPDLDGDVDRHLIVSVLVNLVQNAIKYSPAGSQVRVRCKRTDGGVTFEVEDECGGIPEHDIQNLFSPFVRGTDEGSGLGLGLAIARQAVEAHGGTIVVRNHPGKGCVFVVSVPVRAGSAKRP